jgi:hypothetical protein
MAQTKNIIFLKLTVDHHQGVRIITRDAVGPLDHSFLEPPKTFFSDTLPFLPHMHCSTRQKQILQGVESYPAQE